MTTGVFVLDVAVVSTSVAQDYDLLVNGSRVMASETMCDDVAHIAHIGIQGRLGLQEYSPQPTGKGKSK